MIKTLFRVAVLFSALALPSLLMAQSVEEKINAEMKMSYRTEAELARDSDRKAPEALAFMGLLAVFFSSCVHKTGSIWGVVIAHSIFSVGFLLIWPLVTLWS